jgi:hypothetical protein
MPSPTKKYKSKKHKANVRAAHAANRSFRLTHHRRRKMPRGNALSHGGLGQVPIAGLRPGAVPHLTTELIGDTQP